MRTTILQRLVAVLMGYGGITMLIWAEPLIPLWQGQPPIDSIIVGVLSLVAAVGIMRRDDRWGRQLGVGLVLLGILVWVAAIARYLTAGSDLGLGIAATWIVNLSILGFMLFELVSRWPFVERPARQSPRPIGS